MPFLHKSELLETSEVSVKNWQIPCFPIIINKHGNVHFALRDTGLDRVRVQFILDVLAVLAVLPVLRTQ